MEERYKLYKREFTKLGFDTSIREAQYFYDMIDEVRTLVNEGKNYDEILEMIPRISLEYYHFYYEVPRSDFESGLSKFLDSRDKLSKREKQRVKSNSSIMVPKMSVNDAIIFFAETFNYMDNEKVLEIENVSLEENDSIQKKLIANNN